jgi:serine kinase of HPr protein (carbohydrate metabolism regulator)
MTPRPTSEIVHASCVALGGRAVLLLGPSGAGKSDLALRLIDRGFTLVSDDQTIVHSLDGRLLASAPPTIAGKLEVRGIGIVEFPVVDSVAVALAVDLTPDVDRLPDDGLTRTLTGIAVPLVAIDPRAPSAAIKVGIALDRSAP